MRRALVRAVRLPDQAEPELADPPDIVRLACDRAECAAGGAQIRPIQLRVIQDVEEFHPELQPHELRNLRVLQQGSIQYVRPVLPQIVEVRREVTDVVRELLRGVGYETR